MSEMRKFAYNYLAGKQNLSLAERQAMSERLHQIKVDSIKNLGELKQKAIKNLKANGIKVYETETNQQAREILEKLIPQNAKVVKSKSNAIKELKIDDLIKKNNWELTETDTGDFIASLLAMETHHPVLPSLGISLEQAQAALKKIGLEAKVSAEEIVRVIASHLRQEIISAEIGLTGANAISAEGALLILENEGNISLVSRLPEKHIVVAGIEKIVPTLEEALHVARCASLWALTGKKMTSYINIISGPSKTADIVSRVVEGAQGAKEVHLILLDDWRSGFIGTDFEPLLYCINCGACLNVCPIFLSNLEAIEILDPEKCFHCLVCTNCKLSCPAKIDWKKMTLKAREDFVKKGRSPQVFEEMMANIRQYGNPFGKIKEGEIPDKFYCC